ncbi:DEAD/DEAH box helicase [Marinococcus halotolerans]|uniref:DEAD/DEAH box helicase n=1 Tax=Marinococcus halotolerans TaxID=301092 RepID=UPI0003B65ACC|nr:DEAD/DEAH box helicase [Marinococcus halotolerans]
MTLFSELRLESPILQAIEEMGFEEATPIQSEVIPKAKNGTDIIGQAQTGTGKTAAFGIPLLEAADKTANAPQGIVLAPTRELAVQVSEELNRLGKHKRVTAVAVYGGQDIQRQIKALKRKPQIIVATPGRLMDHVRRKTIDLGKMNTVVLDEADEMLSMGFVDDIEEILKDIPEPRQMLLFSATMPPKLKRVADKFMTNPEQVQVKNKSMTVAKIDQYYIEVNEQEKFETLCNMLDYTPPELAIVFGRTKRRVDELAEALSRRGYAAEGIHGDMKQAQRDKVLQKFKKGTIELLIATDVAARGIDVSGVTHVYNFDLPQDPESYVHRIGRTGRAGNEGVAYSFVPSREMTHLRLIEKTVQAKLKKAPKPTRNDAVEGRAQQAVQKLVGSMEVDDNEYWERTAEELLNEYDAKEIVAAALKMNAREVKEEPVKLTSEAPIRNKGSKGQGKPSSKYKQKRPQGQGHGSSKNSRPPRNKKKRMDLS